MWTGRWTTSSPNIKEEKTVTHPGTELPQPQPGHPAPHSASPNNTQPPANLGSPYPASFPDTIVFTQPTTTSSDILYESINMSQAYPTLTSSLGELQVPTFPRYHDTWLHLPKNITSSHRAPPKGRFPMLNFPQKLQSNKICLNVFNQVQNIEA